MKSNSDYGLRSDEGDGFQHQLSFKVLIFIYLQIYSTKL